MKLTNRLGIPEIFMSAVANDPYDRGDADISVTSLIDAPRVAALTEKHFDEIEVDVVDRLSSMKGQAIHYVLQRSNPGNLICERRLAITVEGWKISGSQDAYDPDVCVLDDYKSMSVSAFSAKFKNGRAPLNMEQQLNIYAQLIRENGEVVKKARIVVWLEGWVKSEALRKIEYPQSPILTFDVPLWSEEQAKKYIRERVILHQQARLTLPECTPTEMWERQSGFAVMKRGGIRAVKVYDNEADAQSHASSDSKLFVEARPGERVRCKSWCSVSRFCTQWSQINTKPADQADEEKEEVSA